MTPSIPSSVPLRKFTMKSLATLLFSVELVAVLAAGVDQVALGKRQAESTAILLSNATARLQPPNASAILTSPSLSLLANPVRSSATQKPAITPAAQMQAVNLTVVQRITISNCEECPPLTTILYKEQYCSKPTHLKEGGLDYEITKPGYAVLPTAVVIQPGQTLAADALPLKHPQEKQIPITIMGGQLLPQVRTMPTYPQVKGVAAATPVMYNRPGQATQLNNARVLPQVNSGNSLAASLMAVAAATLGHFVFY